MIRTWGLCLTLAACGRLGFEAATGVPDGAGSVEAPADLAALECEVDHTTSGTLPFSDQIRVAYSAGAPYVIDIHHVSDTLHELHAYRLTERDGVLVRTDLGVAYSLPDIAGIAIEPDGADHVLVVSDTDGVRTRVLRLDESFALRADTAVGDFMLGLPPYASSTAGRMVVGVTSANMLQVRTLDASFVPIGSGSTLASPAYDASIAPAGADFLVAWSAGGGICRFARVNVAGTIVAGPISVDPGASCTRPVAAVFGAGRVAYIVHEMVGTVDYSAFGGTIDAALATATVPAPLGASPSFADQLVVVGDRVRIPFFNNGTVRIVEMTQAGAISQIGADIGAVSYDSLWIEETSGGPILLRIEGKQLVVRKLCR